ncbi:hypothetical protein JOB18_040511 [Solea senegalensis]|uniref:Uncharacterized protein n=1 Tax=Solea senegalensis TaxID=28829 RepID=A0AAV6R7E5_SOLSE|nr:hypothetical protein JOB18_040511 [Solea senegalensis]
MDLVVRLREEMKTRHSYDKIFQKIWGASEVIDYLAHVTSTRKMVLEYPKSFKDIIEGEVVGSGYDSLAKQLQCSVGNYKRSEMLGKKRIIPDDISMVPENKKQQKDCVWVYSVGIRTCECGRTYEEYKRCAKNVHGKLEE